MLRGKLLEEPRVEIAGVVDQDVDAAEPLDGCLDGSLGVGEVGNVELDHQQVVGRAHGRSDSLRAASGRDNSVPRGERRLRYVGSHTARGASDKPNLPHVASPCANLCVPYSFCL